jgi:hypothetical protein
MPVSEKVGTGVEKKNATRSAFEGEARDFEELRKTFRIGKGGLKIGYCRKNKPSCIKKSPLNSMAILIQEIHAPT